MEWVETTGRTVEEAKDAALDQLGVDEQDAEFDIIEEPRFGLFGRLRAEARVRARVRPTKPRPKDERRDRRSRRRTADASTASSADSAPSAGTAQPGPAESAAPATEDDRGGSVATRTARRRSGSRGAGGQDETGRTTRRTAPQAHRARAASDGDDGSYDDPVTSPGGGMDVAVEEQGAVAREFLEGLVARMNLDAHVATDQVEEETIELNLEGPDLGLLIGPKGTTLLAIQDLARTVVQRKTNANNGRILVDVSGYRRKRKDALARFTRQVAEEVQTTGTRRVLEPMSAADRKIVHDTVNEIEGVTTMSEGEDPRRRVVILPAAAGS